MRLNIKLRFDPLPDPDIRVVFQDIIAGAVYVRGTDSQFSFVNGTNEVRFNSSGIEYEVTGEVKDTPHTPSSADNYEIFIDGIFAARFSSSDLGSPYVAYQRLVDTAASGDTETFFGDFDGLFFEGSNSEDTFRGSEQNDGIYGYLGDDILEGLGGDDTLNGSHGNDRLFGGSGNDSLFGETDADFLDGGLGADRMFGNAGDDIFIVDHVDDVAIEYQNHGTDEIRTFLNEYDLQTSITSNFENLTFIGSGDFEGHGNEYNNVFKGSSNGDSTFNGYDGQDRVVFDEAFSSYAIYFNVSTRQFVLTDTEGRAHFLSSIEEFEFSDGLRSAADVIADLPNLGDDDFSFGEDYRAGSPAQNIFYGNLFDDNGDGVDVAPPGGSLAIADVGGESANGFGLITSTLASGATLEVAAGTGNFRLFINDAYDWLPNGDTHVESVEYSVTNADGNSATATANFTVTGIDSDDVIRGTRNNDNINAGVGNDLVTADAGEDVVRGGSGHDRIMGGHQNDRLFGDGGNDLLKGEAGVDRLTGGTGHDRLIGGGNRDLLRGEKGNDKLFGDEGRDALLGGDHNDLLRGGSDTDVLLGERGHDRLFGDGGRDLLYGGLGRDKLTGGHDRDVFYFKNVTDSFGNQRDTITDFRSRQDVIVVSPIDADSTAGGNQSFKFIGDDAFSRTAGELRYKVMGDNVRVQGDVNGDGRADLQFDVLNVDSLSKFDILL